MYAAENPVYKPLNKLALSMRKGPYKLIAYFGYPDYDNVYELYNLEDDPEEMQNLASIEMDTFSQLKEEMLDALAEANRPYEAE